MPSMIFISHSSKDRPTADAICAHLESAGIKCWIAPRDIEPGAIAGLSRGCPRAALYRRRTFDSVRPGCRLPRPRLPCHRGLPAEALGFFIVGLNPGKAPIEATERVVHTLTKQWGDVSI